jgi:predicted ribosome quality control (RQC) complex YloA/Tae2 family protein
MIIDGIMLRAVANELQETLLGGKVEKIHMPEKDEILLFIHNRGTHRLLLSANASNCRAGLIFEARQNPPVPPAFCMLLRKRLNGARILCIEQTGLERVLRIDFQSRSELGDPVVYTLICEMMGRHSNIMLLDGTQRILDSIKHVHASMSSKRLVLPGLMYEPAPTQHKADPLTLSADALHALLQTYDGKGPLYKWIASSLSGVSYVAAQEIVFRALGREAYAGTLRAQDQLCVAKTAYDFFSSVRDGDYDARILQQNGEPPFGFLPFAYHMYAQNVQIKTDGPSAALHLYYHLREDQQRQRQRAQGLHKAIKHRLDKLHKKLAMQIETIEQTQKAEQYRLYGELLTANLHMHTRGERVRVLNYYTSEEIEIPLDARLSMNANAQRYYKLYQKAKTARKLAGENIDFTRSEIDYLDGQLYAVEQSTLPSELDEIRIELEQGGYLKPVYTKKRIRITPSAPLHYRSSDGHDIYVGKNNAQNDRLTLKSAHPDDLWLHAKETPGSHVIVKAQGGALSDAATYEAALLAAHHSKAGGASNVPVDYCLRRYVKKPGGAKPGMVIYTDYKTAFVTPSKDLIDGIEKV